MGIRMIKQFLLATAALAFSSSAYAHSEDDHDTHKDFTLIHAGTVLAFPGTSPKSKQTIIVHDGKIVGIEDGYVDDDEATIIDGKDMFFLPGLIDSHVHLRGEWSPTSRWDAVLLEPGDVAFQAAKHAKTTLMAGFTAVQDVGGPKEIFALKRAINKGLIPGPHIQAAGSAISITGGHGDTHGFKDELIPHMQSETICDGPSECRHAVRQAVKNGADVIKITATGGVLSNTNAGTGQQFFDDELEAIVEAATKMGRKVTAHAHGKDGIESALKAGVQSIEHGTYLDAGTAAMFKKYDATLVPTVMAGMTVVDWAENKDWLPPNSAKKALEVGPQMQDMARTAYENGVNIAFGTDTGVSEHGKNAEEFTYMVAAGMSEMEAIESATTIASKHIGLEDVIGTLELGKFADIIGVDGNPLETIEELRNVDFVMKGGEIYKGR